ncbi:MAG TPA: penicillin-binding protein 2 [Candidatus Saccharimonadales bacterium]|nr:penicillin-binding protein 2 [Candidatus Saccharimonadales bacterium]
MTIRTTNLSNLTYRTSGAAQPARPGGQTAMHAVGRVRLLYGALVALVAIFGLRLFYMQVIHYTYYKTAAAADQFKQYEIPASRGIIEAHDGNSVVPIVLNQELYTLYADPTYVKGTDQAASKLAAVTGGDASAYARQMRTPNTRYVVLARKLSSEQSQRILALKLPGVGTQGQDYRTYPQGNLAAQLLGFVDGDGVGQYGIEQALNKELSGTPGQVKAVTDVNGVPLAATKGNVETAPTDGSDIVTTLDLSMQAQMEQILAKEYKATKSKGLSAVIMDPDTGQVKAMANYPTYDPANYQDVSDPAMFQNAAVSNAIEPGSIMKTLTTSAALDQGAVTPTTSFYDPAHWLIDGFNITDIEEDGGARQQNIASILSLSLNTGATWLLMQMSQPGGTTITQHGINEWHNYMVDRFRLGQPTEIEQGYESAGYVPADDPTAPALALTYANTSFGQGVQVTALQMAAALSSVLNGGTYYQPTLIDQTVSPSGKTTVNRPHVVQQHVVKPSTGQQLIPLMENVVSTYHNEGFAYMSFPGDYIVGGKTGTAQIANPAGGYYANRYNGTYIGFVGGDQPQYVIVVFNTEPNVSGYAGSNAGQPVFADLAHMLINGSFVAPKSR